jgi:hypothetical protein
VVYGMMAVALIVMRKAERPSAIYIACRNRVQRREHGNRAGAIGPHQPRRSSRGLD